MTPLDVWRAVQHEHDTYPSDAQLLAYLTACEPDNVTLDRAAGMSAEELRMVMHSRNAA